MRSLEVSYYEDLLVYPGVESAASARYQNRTPCNQEKTMGTAGRRRAGGHKTSAAADTREEEEEGGREGEEDSR